MTTYSDFRIIHMYMVTPAIRFEVESSKVSARRADDLPVFDRWTKSLSVRFYCNDFIFF